jgi:hypothetical protein
MKRQGNMALEKVNQHKTRELVDSERMKSPFPSSKNDAKNN